MTEINNPEYNIIKKLNKIGLFFKYLLVVIILLIITYSIYIFTFKLDKVTPDGDKNTYKKAIINISFNSEQDLRKSQKYLKEYDEVFYNKTNSGIKTGNYTPIYQINIEKKGSLFSMKPEFNAEDLYRKNLFYFFKHYLDSTAYKRGDVFKPKLEELYSGKIIFESFFKTSYPDFANLIAGIILSDDLYASKYSEQIKKVIFQTIKTRKSYLLSSYNNKDSSTHKNLLKAYSIYYTGASLKESLLTGKYFLANELIADARYFKFTLKDNHFQYKINFREKVFIIFIFKDGKLIRKLKQLQYDFNLKPGLYNIVILKKEETLYGMKELFWIYLNFRI